MDPDLDGLPGEEPNEHRLHAIVELKGFFPILDGHEALDSGLHATYAVEETRIPTAFPRFPALSSTYAILGRRSWTENTGSGWEDREFVF